MSSSGSVYNRVMEYERRINSGQEEPPRDEEEQDRSIEGENNSQSEAESREVTDSEGRGVGTEDGDYGAYDNDEEIDRDERGNSTIADDGAEDETKTVPKRKRAT